MTGFGRARETVNGRDITVEMKAVNNRYMDCSVKLPRAFSYLEERVKPYLQSRGISRGKLDVFISIERTDAPATAIRLDEVYAAEYVAVLRRLGEVCNLPDDISVMSVAQNKDLFCFTVPEDDMEKEWESLCTVLSLATDRFLAAREREGANIDRDIKGKLEKIRERVLRIDSLSESDIKSYRQKLEQRLRDMLEDNRITVDENRILTECAIFADRIAIDEELVRLRSHFGAFAEISGERAPSGKKLDFLMQEMNRETNTIGSKANNAGIARLVVEMKNELEKIREQVQNIE